MKKTMRVLTSIAIFGLIIFLGVYISSHNIEVLNPQGVIALAEKNLLIAAVSLMMIVIIPVFVMLFAFLWRYREGNTGAKYTPDWHSNIALEITWWVIPTVIIIILANLTWTSTHDLDPFKPIDGTMKLITIQVVALDWKWLFIYPDEHIATVNFVEFPKDTPINFKITADAPMNAFWIPQLAGQVYAMAGMTAQLHLLATKSGDYKGLSSNFSGDGFGGMKFTARVTSQKDFDSWVQEVKSASSTLSFDEYTALTKQTKNNPVTYYASTEDDLYTKIIMKFMSKDGTTTSTSHVGMPGMNEY